MKLRQRPSLVSRWKALLSGRSAPLFLLFLSIAAYGVFIPRLGYYWDDFPFAWIAHSMGKAGLARYFSTNRPVWGLFYQAGISVLGVLSPWVWHLLALLMRWLAGVAFWSVVRLGWSRLPRAALAGAAIFVLYPGFTQQSIGILYTNFFLVYAIFLFSLAASLAALRSGKQKAALLQIMAWVLAAINLFAMEYFLLLEIARPLLLLFAEREQAPEQPVRQRVMQAARAWLPFAMLIPFAMIWRSVGVGFHTYQPTLFSSMASRPLETIFALILTALADIFKTTVLAWGSVLQVPDPLTTGQRGLMLYGAVIAVTLIGGLLFLLRTRDEERAVTRREWMAPLGVALPALAIAGAPFWLTGLPVGLSFATDRFTLPFWFGSCLLTGTLWAALPIPRMARTSLLVAALALAAGAQTLTGLAYQREWEAVNGFFWQMRWRIPALQAGTTLLSNELPFAHYSDNSLSAPLNWIYDTDNAVVNDQVMRYMLYYPTLRAEREDWILDFGANRPIERDYLAATFEGNTGRVVVFAYNPPGCVRILDPALEESNWMLPTSLRAVLPLASQDAILQEGRNLDLSQTVFLREPAHGWCYYYELADLARQFGEWQTVSDLAEQAFATGDYPNDPAERMPFIEGYAHTGQWDKALTLSRETRAVTNVMTAGLCTLWQRIDEETAPSAEKEETLRTARGELGCIHD